MSEIESLRAEVQELRARVEKLEGPTAHKVQIEGAEDVAKLLYASMVKY